MDPSNWPAIWSAVAASFSAIAAMTVALIHRANLIEATSPHLVLGGWTRTASGVRGDSEIIRFGTIRNIGKGVAMHVYANVYVFGKMTDPVAGMTTLRVPVIAPGDAESVDGDIRVWWKDDRDLIPLEVKMYVWDTMGRRHETAYHVHVVRPKPNVYHAGPELAPGVIFATRSTRHRSVHLLKLRTALPTLSVPVSMARTALRRLWTALSRRRH